MTLILSKFEETACYISCLYPLHCKCVLHVQYVHDCMSAALANILELSSITQSKHCFVVLKGEENRQRCQHAVRWLYCYQLVHLLLFARERRRKFMNSQHAISQLAAPRMPRGLRLRWISRWPRRRYARGWVLYIYMWLQLVVITS